LVDEHSELYGLDSMEHSIAAARENYGRDSRLNFSCVDFSRGIPFEDEKFDLVFSNNMLECMMDKQALLREIFRVLKPGGQVVCAHYDWDSQLIDGNDKALVRRIVQTFNDWKQDWMSDIDAWMGRRLWRTFQESGLFTHGRVETFVLTNTEFAEPYYGHMMIHDFQALVRRKMITGDEYQKFLTDIQELDRQGQYFYSITMYIYVGEK
jgi:ubiquinone/menaquinone biosynthesis C-methylase UbiE